MQFIFLLDAIKLHTSLSDIFLSPQFLLDAGGGLVLLYLLRKYPQAIIQLLTDIRHTNHFINEIIIKKISQRYLVFKSNDNLIFTAGLLRPKIYLSTQIKKSHSSAEIKAMFFHEQNHQKNYHPLKLLITNLVNNIYPHFPGKKWLIGNFITSTEVACDQFAETKIKTRLPLVSALFKLQKLNLNQLALANVSYFNSQSERIKILVGQKKPIFKRPLALYSIIIATFLFSTIAMKNTSIFFDCQHIIKCLQILMTPSSQSLKTTINTLNYSPVLSDHCL